MKVIWFTLASCIFGVDAKMPFLDIAFQAEISRFEDQEFEELAWRNCSEDPKTRDKIIQELRTMIKERGECNPRRIDDAYLLRFLRCRRFRPELAYKLMVRYEDFRRNSAQLYDCDPFTLHKVKNVYAGVVPENPINGRIVIVKCSGWDPAVAPVTDLTRVALIMNEVTLLQPKMQILGFTLILDLGGLSITQMRHLSTTFAYQTVSVLGVAFPLMVHGLHIINYSRYLSPAFYIFKQFIPTSIWNRICFHGSDVKTLHGYIDPEFLPPEYGGTCRCIAKFEEWITKIDLYKDDFLVRELRGLGFTVK